MTLGQAQQCGRVKAANGIPTFPSCSTTIINMILRDYSRADGDVLRSQNGHEKKTDFC